ncbi:hypothetical protein I4F81_000846 [Pyropia yezoensis]|uniref:Uncharacterized protein n=1 Tax=Pyropia yezoensis TaxID=2788 RepID=A0ACC3BJV0_PYRYE|nr:hypothetical protein I4F81_000846 [Neopyropia yezoensis]
MNWVLMRPAKVRPLHPPTRVVPLLLLLSFQALRTSATASELMLAPLLVSSAPLAVPSSHRLTSLLLRVLFGTTPTTTRMHSVTLPLPKTLLIVTVSILTCCMGPTTWSIRLSTHSPSPFHLPCERQPSPTGIHRLRSLSSPSP